MHRQVHGYQTGQVQDDKRKEQNNSDNPEDPHPTWGSGWFIPSADSRTGLQIGIGRRLTRVHVLFLGLVSLWAVYWIVRRHGDSVYRPWS